MFGKMITWLVVEQSAAEKLSILAGMLLFVCFLYWILPKVMGRKIKGYHEQCEIDEEEKSEEHNSETQL